MLKLNSRARIFKKILCVIVVIGAMITSLFAGFNIMYIKTYVKGQSMSPTLNMNISNAEKGDTIYINRFAKVERNDIIVLNIKDEEENSYIIKRIIALEGDIVNILDDKANKMYHLIVNEKIVCSKLYQFDGAGRKVEYNTVESFKSYIQNNKDDNSRIARDDDDIKGVIIKKGEVYLLGDNWNVSKDSSLVGPYKHNNIIGRVDFVVEKGENDFINILKQIFYKLK